MKARPLPGRMLVLMLAAGLCSCARPGTKPAGPGAVAASAPPFAEPDARALSAPPGAAASVESLARYLTEGFDAEEARARSVFRWMAANIHYNVSGHGAPRPGASRADSVLRSRSALCEGYADLFTALARTAGLQAEIVSGYAKGVGYRAGDPFSGPPDHAWNAVMVDGEWRLVDCTWAAGIMDLAGGYVSRFEPFYFSPPPRDLLHTHFPSDARWQLVDPPIALADFERLPNLKPPFFRHGLGAVNQEDCTIHADGHDAPLTIKTPPGVHIMGKLVTGPGAGSEQGITVEALVGAFTVRARVPETGACWLHVYAADTRNDAHNVRTYEWAAEYRLVGR